MRLGHRLTVGQQILALWVTVRFHAGLPIFNKKGNQMKTIMRYIKSLLFGTLLCTISILSSNGYAMNNNNYKKFGVGCYFNVDSFYNIMKERGKEYIPNQFCESSEENIENYLIQSKDNSNDNKVESKEDINMIQTLLIINLSTLGFQIMNLFLQKILLDFISCLTVFHIIHLLINPFL